MKTNMRQIFHQRFNIEVGMDEAKRCFVNRVHNFVFRRFLDSIPSEGDRARIIEDTINGLGAKPRYGVDLARQIGEDFDRNLEALEYLFNALYSSQEGYRRCRPPYDDPFDYHRNQLTECVNEILAQSEIDLEIRWQDGYFIRSGAALLDESLVNEPLRWLSANKYDPVRTPFEKALRHFAESLKRPELLSDVITDMYEALEALAKIVTNRPDKDLSALQELFIKEVKASPEYKQLLRDYIAYANNFRHALKEGKSRPNLSQKETESFIYLTGLFIRLAMP
jgi:hypothetical protein